MAYLLTWRTFGTWLPGDKRGWWDHKRGYQAASPELENYVRKHMTQSPVRLAVKHRRVVKERITAYCEYRNWPMHAVTCQSNHVHVVISALPNPKRVMATLKSRCTRELKELFAEEFVDRIWAKRGSVSSLYSLESMKNVAAYVANHECLDG
jgi:REP element-mobilizing transposase RayT